MRDRPVLVHAVAAETAPDLVVDAALGHFHEREARDRQAQLAAVERMTAQAVGELERMRELGRAADAAVDAVEDLRKLAHGGIERRSLQGSLASSLRERTVQGGDQRGVLLRD